MLKRRLRVVVPHKPAKLVDVPMLGEPVGGEAMPRTVFNRADLMNGFQRRKPFAQDIWRTGHDASGVLKRLLPAFDRIVSGVEKNAVAVQMRIESTRRVVMKHGTRNIAGFTIRKTSTSAHTDLGQIESHRAAASSARRPATVAR